MARPFTQVDVFAPVPYRGNPVAVVLDGEGLSTETMQRFASWTNLSETTFVLPPSDGAADYRVRIFTPNVELPFAGHPTLGTAHAWLEMGGSPGNDGSLVQECGAGLVPLRRAPEGLAFAAPPRNRADAIDNGMLGHVSTMLGIDPDRIVASHWADNGPPWIAVLLETPEEVLALEVSGKHDLYVGVAAPYPDGSPEAFEVRAFFPKDGATAEDPVTGSLNASLAQWLLETGKASAPYVARQGTALGRQGLVRISADPDGQVWVGGGTVTCVTGDLDL